MKVLGRRIPRLSAGLFFFTLLPAAFAALPLQVPPCPAYRLKSENGGNPGDLAVNTAQVLGWKASTQNQMTGRGHVQGVIARIYPDRNGHEHFSIQIGAQPTDTLEIVYNEEFGAVPTPRVGMTVEACGDYITSTGPSPGPNGEVYPASPDGALIHWVHLAPHRSGHTSGYLVVDGVLTGQSMGAAAPAAPAFEGSNEEFSPGPTGIVR